MACIDHCIDEIRLSIVCHSDISVITWGWKDTEATPYANFKVEHECRNWDSILEWTKAHQADQNAIVRPIKQHHSSKEVFIFFKACAHRTRAYYWTNRDHTVNAKHRVTAKEQ